MQIENYNCKKCGLTISSTCSKCDKIVDVEVLDDGCIVQKTKCVDCANAPVITVSYTHLTLPTNLSV